MKNSLIFLLMLTILQGCTRNTEKIDHVILAVNDLDKGVAQFKSMTGIEPVYGGVHPNSFTHNALVSLSGNTYL